MEKLEPLAHDHPIRAHLQNGIIGNAENVLERFKSGHYDSLKDAYPGFYKSIHKLARDMVGDGSVNPTASFDLHLGNVMQRKDGTPVITDPLVSYHDDDNEGKGVSAAKLPFGTNTLKKVLGAKTAPVAKPMSPSQVVLRDRLKISTSQQPRSTDIVNALDAGVIGSQTAERIFVKRDEKFANMSLPSQTPLPKTTDIMKAKNIGAIGTATANRIFARKKLAEEAPVNNAGSGNVAGLGVGPKGEPGRKPMMPMVRRSKDFAGKAVFSVPPNLYDEARLEKRKYQRWTKYLEENSYDELAPIREFANANPTKPIIIENEKTGAMCYVKYGSKK
jgi:hypothetical protein